MRANIDFREVRSRLMLDLVREPTAETAALRTWAWGGGLRKLGQALEEGHEEAAPLLHEVVGMPDDYRAVLLAHFLEGWTAAEVAERFDMEPSEAERRLRQGMWELRERLKKAGL